MDGWMEIVIIIAFFLKMLCGREMIDLISYKKIIAYISLLR